ncbi:MAG: type II toxin-antitoxin system PemK/MazF family toxin [Acetobacteraceae bacterium]
MRRGDLVTVAPSGDYGKPRPALVIQSDFLPESDSVLVCLLTTTLRETPLSRLSLPPGEGTGLREPSQVMVDKIMAVRRDRCGAPIGRIDEAVLLAVSRLFAFVIGIAD